MSSALWAGGRRRLAGAVEGAEVRLSGDEIVMEFSGQDKALAVFAKENHDEIEASCREVFGPAARLTIEVEGGAAEGIEGDDALMRVVLQDQGVVLVQKVLGGEVISALPDGDPN